MKKTCLMILLLLVMMTNNKAVFANTTSDLYFYIEGCSSCEKVELLISKLNLDIEYVDIAKDYEYFQEVADSFNIPNPKRAAPAMVIGGQFLDYDNITEDSINNGRGLSYAARGMEAPFSIYLLSLGLIAGINPCSLSFILLLFASITLKPREILKVGFTYILGKVVVYTALGAAFILAFEFSQGWILSVKRPLEIGVAIIALGLGLFYIKDFIEAYRQNYGKVKMQLPSSFKKKNHALIARIASSKNSSVLTILMLSIMISTIEFLCTGQSFILSISFMHTDSAQMLMYDFGMFLLGMIIPLVSVVIILSIGRSVDFIGNIIYKTMPVIKLFTAIIFILFAINMLIN